VSYASAKGYMAEHATVQYLSTQLGASATRPRTTSITNVDTGDVVGVPLVVSVKNHAALNLAVWVDEMAAMVKRSPWDVGVVVHKRRGKGHPRDWYVTTPFGLVIPMLAAYVAQIDG
jgi:hypothetical protein